MMQRKTGTLLTDITGLSYMLTWREWYKCYWKEKSQKFYIEQAQMEGYDVYIKKVTAHYKQHFFGVYYHTHYRSRNLE